MTISSKIFSFSLFQHCREIALQLIRKEDNIMLSFLSNEEALAKELHQELGVHIIVENKDKIINPGNWYWCDEDNRVIARCYYEMR